MKKLASAIFALGAAFAFSSAANAEQYPTKAYDCVYELVQPTGTSVTTHTITDGKGHLRTESTTSGMKTVMLMDYPNSHMLTLMETQKMAMKAKIPPNSYNGYNDEDLRTKNHAKDLGTKEVAGHPCHGWGYSSAGSSTEVWMGNDIGVFVQSTTVVGGKKTVQTLKSYSGKTPDAALFSMDVPAGFKVMGNW